MGLIKKITSWSFSRWNIYDQCALKAKYKFIDKLPEPRAQPLERGNIIHKQAELYILGQPCPILDESKPLPILGKDGSLPLTGVKYHKKGALPPELKKFQELFESLRERHKLKSKVSVLESNWAFRQDWSKTVGTDWTGAWLRVKVDEAHESDPGVLELNDWKTGKYNPDLAAEYKIALQLYALGALLWYDHIDEVRSYLRYTDLGVTWPGPDEELVYTREDLPKLKEIWLKRTKQMLNDTIFAPKPNAKCTWCPYSKNFVDRNTGKLTPGPCRF